MISSVLYLQYTHNAGGEGLNPCPMATERRSISNVLQGEIIYRDST